MKLFPGESVRRALAGRTRGRWRPKGWHGVCDTLRMMRLESAFALLLLVGCDQGPPPFEELPLRDALHADPDIVASLPDTARVQLAARFETARAKDDRTDEVATGEAISPAAMVAALDGVRVRRKGEPLVVGIVSNGAAWPVREHAYPPRAPVLPPIEGRLAAATATLENWALQGEGGAAVRALFAASGAHHLHRVVGWPVGAVAIEDTVYVNGSWLVSLAPAGADGGVADGAAEPGATAASNNATGATSWDGIAPVPANAAPAEILRGALPSANRGDAGVVQQPSGTDPQPPAAGDVADSCATCAAGCDTGDGDSCDSGDDSCASASDDGSDGGGDPCASTGDDGGDACAGAGDGADAASCQVSHGSRHRNSETRIWLLAPLAFLLLRRRS